MAIWQDQGPDNDIVISSRVRLARNVQGYAFPRASEQEQGREVADRVIQAVSHGGEGHGFTYIQLSLLDPLQREELVERYVASRDLVKNAQTGSLLLSADETMSIMINEEDHLRIQGMLSGSRLQQAAQRAFDAEALVQAGIAFVFDEQLGYLTSCPTNVGTGMRASMMLHLPALKMTGLIKPLLDSVLKAGLAVRGVHGEGTEALGDLYQISNQTTLGITEEDIVEMVNSVCVQLVQKERQARALLFENKRIELQDRLLRSLGTLKYARHMTSQEAMRLLSDLRLAVGMQMVQGVTGNDITRLSIAIQPCSLQQAGAAKADAEQRDVQRADFIRHALAGARVTEEE